MIFSETDPTFPMDTMRGLFKKSCASFLMDLGKVAENMSVCLFVDLGMSNQERNTGGHHQIRVGRIVLFCFFQKKKRKKEKEKEKRKQPSCCTICRI